LATIENTRKRCWLETSGDMKSKKHILLSPNAEIRAAYNELIADIESMMSALTDEHFSTMLQCRPGCSECCMQFSVLPLEAAILAAELENKDTTPHQSEKCLLLDDDLCTVYEVRPIICRTQGLALAYIDESAGAIEVSACPLNFPDDFSFTHENVLYMDQFNQRLAALNLRYCHETGLAPETRIALADLVA
jgi:Fe-S-cluster containining protein